jgi:hypothetical protein
MPTGRPLHAAAAAIVLLAVVLLPHATMAQAPAAAGQEPETRAEAQRQRREARAEDLEAPEPGRLERALLDLESGRFMERLLNPPQGLYPRVGNITAGSGIAFGPGYREPGLFGGHADFQATAAASFAEYWMIDTSLHLPRLSGGRLALDVHGRRYSFPDQEFFGLGPASRREDLAIYGISATVVGGGLSYRPVGWLQIDGAADWLSHGVDAGSEPGEILSVFDASTLPGVAEAPDYAVYGAGVAVDYADPRGNARRGGRYRVGVRRFEDLDGDPFAFTRVDVDLRQYVPLVHGRRVIALRALASMSEADAGATVPFFLQPTLGGPDDLRGFRRFRFRDRNMLLLQGEYRWEIFTAMDGVLFYDAGMVAPRVEDLTLGELETDYGFGFRFGTVNGVFLRVEGAFGSNGGKHFILRFGDAF